MTVYLTGHDLARIYAAALGTEQTMGSPAARAEAARYEARASVRDFMGLIAEMTGQEPHIGEPTLWEPDNMRGIIP